MKGGGGKRTKKENTTEKGSTNMARTEDILQRGLKILAMYKVWTWRKIDPSHFPDVIYTLSSPLWWGGGGLAEIKPRDAKFRKKVPVFAQEQHCFNETNIFDTALVMKKYLKFQFRKKVFAQPAPPPPQMQLWSILPQYYRVNHMLCEQEVLPILRQWVTTEKIGQNFLGTQHMVKR